MLHVLTWKGKVAPEMVESLFDSGRDSLGSGGVEKMAKKADMVECSCTAAIDVTIQRMHPGVVLEK